MPATKRGAAPGVVVAESRVLLSSAAPMLSHQALRAVAHEVRAIVGELGRTDDIARADARLTELSAQVPSGPEGLAPRWRVDVGLFNPQVAGSIAATRRRLLDDLDRFVRAGGIPPVPGPGPTIPPAPPPVGPVAAPSLDSVTIRNTTGLPLAVTVHLEVPQVQKPWITRTIPAQGSLPVLFDFGSATDAFLSIDVRRADGGRVPPPFVGFQLPRPMPGYAGALFTISQFGPYFNVAPG